MLFSSSDTRKTCIMMHLFMFTNIAQKELVSIWTQRIRNSNQLSLPYYLDHINHNDYIIIILGVVAPSLTKTKPNLCMQWSFYSRLVSCYAAYYLLIKQWHTVKQIIQIQFNKVAKNQIYLKFLHILIF